jgi:hypothetical protein
LEVALDTINIPQFLCQHTITGVYKYLKLQWLYENCFPFYSYFKITRVMYLALWKIHKAEKNIVMYITGVARVKWSVSTT